MTARKNARRKFFKDITRTRHMTTVSAVVLATTFMPLLGIPDVEELRTFQKAVEGFTDARAAVLEPRRNDRAARERSARVVGEAPERSGWRIGPRSYRTLTVDRPQRERVEAVDAVLPPLPSADEVELSAPPDIETLPVAEEVRPHSAPVTSEQVRREAPPAAQAERRAGSDTTEPEPRSERSESEAESVQEED